MVVSCVLSRYCLRAMVSSAELTDEVAECALLDRKPILSDCADSSVIAPGVSSPALTRSDCSVMRLACLSSASPQARAIASKKLLLPLLLLLLPEGLLCVIGAKASWVRGLVVLLIAGAPGRCVAGSGGSVQGIRSQLQRRRLPVQFQRDAALVDLRDAMPGGQLRTDEIARTVGGDQVARVAGHQRGDALAGVVGHR